MKYRSLLLLLSLPLSILYAKDADLEERLKQLSRELDRLKEQVKDNSADIEERSAILEKVETKSILDKINFSPNMELRFDKMRYTNNYIEGENTYIPDPANYTGPAPAPGTLQRRDQYTKEFQTAATIYFDLDMKASLTSTTSFYGRLSFANTTQSNQRLCILSRDIKSQTASSAFDVTLAFFDYTPNPSSEYRYTFSFGLLPTFNGTPMQYAQNSKRESMFPALVFDMNSYGVIYTQKLKRTYLRTILARAYTLREVFYPYQCNRENIDNATIAGLYMDSSFEMWGASALLTLGFNALVDFKAHPYLGPDITSSQTDVLGNIYTTGIGLDLEDVATMPLTLFAHMALSIPDGNGNIQDYKIVRYENGVGLNTNGDVAFTEADYASGEMLQHSGHAFFTGGRYDITPVLQMGAEYNYGSKYWFAATQGAKSMYNKLATRGFATEGYLNWIYSEHLFAKLGYLYIHESYTGSGWHFGEPAKKDADQEIWYLSLNAKF